MKTKELELTEQERELIEVIIYAKNKMINTPNDK